MRMIAQNFEKKVVRSYFWCWITHWSEAWECSMSLSIQES